MLKTSKDGIFPQESGFPDVETQFQLFGVDLSAQELSVCIDKLLHSSIPRYFQTCTDTCQDLLKFQTFVNSLVQYIKELGSYKRMELLALDHRLLDPLMALTQMLSDALLTESPLRTFLLDLLLQLSVEANIVPEYLELQGISAVSEHPVFVGGFGDVWKASFGGNMVALKTPRMPINQAKLHRNLCREALLWRQLRHHNILAFLGLCHTALPCPAIVSPWMQNGTVLSFVKTNFEVERLEILLEISEAIAYLHGHSPPIIHQDIRCANVLIDEHNHAVLADFGLSRLDSEYFNTFTSSLEHGCIRWQAPELLFPGEEAEHPKPSCASDIWAFGMLMLELFTGKQPFSNTVIDTAVVIDIYHGRKPGRPTLFEITGEGFSDHLWECMNSCWAKAPADRLYSVDICTSLKTLRRERKKAQHVEFTEPQASLPELLPRNDEPPGSARIARMRNRSMSRPRLSSSKVVTSGRRKALELDYSQWQSGGVVEASSSSDQVGYETDVPKYLKFPANKSIVLSASDAPFIIGVNNRNAILLGSIYGVQITSYIEQDLGLVLISCTSSNPDFVDKAFEELQKLVEFQKLFGGETKQTMD